MGIVTDLDICTGCNACMAACKAWDGPDKAGGSSGMCFNHVHSYEIIDEQGPSQIIHFPRSCLHCEDAACVTVCPTGASYKRREDGIVMIDDNLCIGCNLCAWACPYGAHERDPDDGTMKKCTLCVDRIENPALPEGERIPACVQACPTGARSFGDLADPDSTVSHRVTERGGYDLLSELDYKPTNQYLPPRRHPSPAGESQKEGRFWRWVDRTLSR